MESVLSLSMESCERDIKYTRKWVRYQVLWVTFNFALVAFDWQTFYLSSNHVTAVSFGAILVTAIWSLVFLLESHSELRASKQMLQRFKEIHNEHLSRGADKQYEMAKEHYESLIAQIIKEYPEVKDKYVRQC